ncbi:MAG TPA: hypothetical protein VFZ00_08695 [Solirubrobacter sp.]|nr:hypothetical protein [Solirubrobacter sp.]
MAEGGLSRAAAALLAAAAVAAAVAAPVEEPRLAAVDAAVGIAFAVGGAATLPMARSVGLLAFAVAAAWAAGTLAGLGGVPSYLAGVAVLLHRAPLALLLLVYPGRHLHGTPARALAVAALASPFVPGDGGPYATTAAVCLVAVVVGSRAVRSPAALRPPVAVAAAAAIAIAIPAALGAAQVGTATGLLVVYDAAMLAAAVALLAPLAGGRWRAAATAGLAIELGATPTGAPVTARLAEVLHDPGLELRLRLPGAGWTDEGGHPAREPAAASAPRALLRRVLGDGTEVALLHDPAAVPDRTVAEAAVAAAATAIDNARRQRDIKVRIEERRRLRRGLLEAADEERRQLETELRSGPLRAVDELDELLCDLPTKQAERPRNLIAEARSELASIALGLHPKVVIDNGLASALADLGARAPVPVVVEASSVDGSIPAPVAVAAYYVASEALANVAKHARATRARIELATADRELILRVADNGVGGAAADGPGLTGLRNRVHALDGALHVLDGREGGTVVEARLPIS